MAKARPIASTRVGLARTIFAGITTNIRCVFTVLANPTHVATHTKQARMATCMWQARIAMRIKQASMATRIKQARMATHMTKI